MEVEGDMNRGLPSFNIVGMANKTINEAKDRVRSAITNSQFSFPDKKVTISLAPADLQKDGAYLDLPIALSVLVLSGQLIKEDVSGKIFVGELSLNGELRPLKGRNSKEGKIPRNLCSCKKSSPSLPGGRYHYLWRRYASKSFLSA